MTSFVSHTTIDSANAYEQSRWWQAVLDYVEDPNDPNLPGHEECRISSRDGSHHLLFIEVPDAKQVKNRVTSTCDRRRARETTSLRGSSPLERRRCTIAAILMGRAGWYSPTPKAMSFASSEAWLRWRRSAAARAARARSSAMPPVDIRLLTVEQIATRIEVSEKQDGLVPTHVMLGGTMDATYPESGPTLQELPADRE